MIYRGQRYGEPIGEWWTSSPDDALSFAMSRGGNRTYVVLSVDEDDETWLAQFVFAVRDYLGQFGIAFRSTSYANVGAVCACTRARSHWKELQRDAQGLARVTRACCT